jgi:pyruvate dehydrogenase E1 component alpha subunit
MKLARDTAIALLRQMIRIRRFEEQCAQSYSAGKIRGFLHLYIGEEAIAAGVMPALTPEDAVVATYREHGHALARGITPESIMAEMTASRRDAAAGAADPCTCSTPSAASTAETQSSAAGFRLQ